MEAITLLKQIEREGLLNRNMQKEAIASIEIEKPIKYLAGDSKLEIDNEIQADISQRPYSYCLYKDEVYFKKQTL